MKKNLLPLIILAVLINIGCEEEGLSEQEVLALASDRVSVYVNVTETGNSRPISDATVSVVGTDGTISLQTNEIGLVYFEDLVQGDVIVKINKEGYFDYEQEVTIFSDGRSSDNSFTFSIYNEVDVATINGVIQIQTDLTTEEPELVAGVTVVAMERISSSQATFISQTTSDENGEYELIIPTSEDGRSIFLDFPQLVFDQTVAILNDEDIIETRTFKNTVFSPSPYDEAEEIPNTANIRLAPYSPNISSGRQAYIKSVTVESGVITDIELGDVGYGYSYSRDIPTIISDDGGADAEIHLYAGYQSELVNCGNYPYYYQIDDYAIFDGGFGYPDYVPNQNVSTTHPHFIWTDDCKVIDLSEVFYVYSGEDVYLDVNYGTGTTLGTLE